MIRTTTTALCTMLSCVCSISAHAADASVHQNIINFSGESCPHGLHHQPNGAFAVIVFCEDALGTSLAVVCYDAGKYDRLLDVKSGEAMGWEIADRVCQQAPWAADVTSIAWSPNGKFLYVASSEPYGAGGLFQLDLDRRAATQILPKNVKVTLSEPGPGYMIAGLSEDGKTLRVETLESEDVATMRTETVTLSP